MPKGHRNKLSLVKEFSIAPRGNNWPWLVFQRNHSSIFKFFLLPFKPTFLHWMPLNLVRSWMHRGFKVLQTIVLLAHHILKHKYEHLSMKEGNLFCFVVMRSTKPGCFRSCSWCLWKDSDKEGCMGLVPWHLDFLCKSSWILNDFFTEN
jgi:hypothetical protein